MQHPATCHSQLGPLQTGPTSAPALLISLCTVLLVVIGLWPQLDRQGGRPTCTTMPDAAGSSLPYTNVPTLPYADTARQREP